MMKPLSLLSFLLAFSLFAQESEIVRMQGESTLLQGQGLAARRLISSMRPRPGEVLSTAIGANIVLRFPNQVTATLGENSRLVFESYRPGLGVELKLLQGQLRVNATQYQSKERASGGILGKDYSIIVSTSSSVVGTQNGRFHLSAPLKERSLVLVYEGQANYAKLDPKSVEQEVFQTEQMLIERHIERNYQGEVEVSDIVTSPLLKRQLAYRALMNSERRALVGSGQFSMVRKNWRQATVPVFISVQQFNALFHYSELIAPGASELSPASLDFARPVVSYADAQVRPEGLVDQSRAIVAAKAGGLIDFSTAHYIQPGKEARFDEESALYLSLDHGTIDSHTGAYLAPAHLRLEMQRGFIVTDSKLAENTRNAAAAKALELNQNLFASTDRKQPIERYHGYSYRELLTRNNIKLSLMPYSQKFDLTGSSLGNDKKLESNLGQIIDVSLSYRTPSTWQFIHQIRLKKLEYKTPVGVDKGNTLLFGIGVGVRKYWSSRINTVFDIQVDQDHFIETLPATSTLSETLSAITTTKLRLLVEWQIIRSENFRLETSFGLVHHLEKETRDLVTSAATGFYIDLRGLYWINPKWAVELGPWYQSHSQDISSQSFNASTKRQSLGGQVGLIHSF